MIIFFAGLLKFKGGNTRDSGNYYSLFVYEDVEVHWVGYFAHSYTASKWGGRALSPGLPALEFDSQHDRG